MSRDLRWLLSMGVGVEEIAARVARTPTAIRAELEADEEERDGRGVR